jgi:hypothetical protein
LFCFTIICRKRFSKICPEIKNVIPFWGMTF